MTFGRAVELKNFTSIFDFLMMICYREGNPDMIPVRILLLQISYFAVLNGHD